ncbi:MAG: acyl-CoA dehydrogenase family protein [Myxococcota bacterium]
MLQREVELVESVRDLARKKFAERAAQADRERRFPRENMDELVALGVHALILPQDIGGLGMGAEALVRVMEAIAWADASTAVALNMHVLIAHFLRFIPMFPHGARVIEDIARGGALICGPGSVPTGDLDNRKSGFRVREAGDRWIVDGKAGFASMSEGATYVMLGGWIEGSESQEPRALIAMPRSDSPGMRNLRNWDAMGMRATASHDIECVGLEIPRDEAFVAPLSLLREGQRSLGVEAQKVRSWGALGILGIWVGLAQAAFEFTLEYVGKRHGYLAGHSQAGGEVGYRSDEAWAQVAIGRMDHWLGTGRVVLDDTLRRLDGPFDDVAQFTRHMVRTVYHLRRMSEEVAGDAMRTCGAHAYVTGSRLERIYRDMIGGNVMAWKTDQLVHMLGLASLGREITLAGPAGT